MEPVLSNPTSDRVKKVRALHRRSSRERAGQFLAEGPQSVREVLRFAPGTVDAVYYVRGERSAELVELADTADEAALTALLQGLKGDYPILLVEHDMDAVFQLADRITVLQRGAVLAEGNYAEVSSNPQVMEAYMGTTDGQLQGAH